MRPAWIVRILLMAALLSASRLAAQQVYEKAGDGFLHPAQKPARGDWTRRGRGPMRLRSNLTRSAVLPPGANDFTAPVRGCPQI
jgi:hypothetical protein